MFALIPLMVIPLVAYNLIAVFGSGGAPLAAKAFSIAMMSGGQWTMTMGDVLLAFSLLFLFVEIVKSTRTSNASVLDHLLSAIVFVIFLIEFLLVPSAATSVFFLLMCMAAIDLLAGFSVSIRSAGRDVSYH